MCNMNVIEYAHTKNEVVTFIVFGSIADKAIKAHSAIEAHVLFSVKYPGAVATDVVQLPFE